MSTRRSQTSTKAGLDPSAPFEGLLMWVTVIFMSQRDVPNCGKMLCAITTKQC